ncbi:MAG TPA: DUF6089 family protein [Segetibacter sp.]|jgi:hypothetical protein
MKLFCFRILLLFITTILAANVSSFSQYYYYNNKFYDSDVIWEFGGSFGGMYSLTDVGKKQYNAFLPGRLDYKTTKANGGIYAGVLYQNLIGARIEITYGSVSGADSTGSPDRKVRNLSYRSDIREVAFIGEVHPLTLTNWEHLPAISPYLVGGIGWFSFNPQANYKGRWVNLQPLNTAGQGFEEYPESKPYRLAAICLPFGVGFKYDLSPLFAARFEIIERYTFTDYLDDASAPYIDPEVFYTYFAPEKAALAEALANRSNRSLKGIVRGGMQTKDKYLTINLKLAMMLGREKIK